MKVTVKLSKCAKFLYKVRDSFDMYGVEQRTMNKILLIILALVVQNVLLAQKKYSFRGKLGKSIAFRLDLEQNKEGIVAGETTYYRKNGKIAKIPVYGWFCVPTTEMKSFGYTKNTLMLNEYNGIKQCGSFYIELTKGEIESGTWSLGDKELKINNIEKTIFPSGVKYLHPATGTDINGDYSFEYARGEEMDDCGGSCTMTYKNGKVHYGIATVTPNIAEEENSATLNGSYFTGAHDDYKYKGYIDRNFVAIWTTNNEPVDDWGAHATLDGIYVKE